MEDIIPIRYSQQSNMGQQISSISKGGVPINEDVSITADVSAVMEDIIPIIYSQPNATDQHISSVSKGGVPINEDVSIC